MKRRDFLSGSAALMAFGIAAGAVFAQTFADDVIAQLVRQGYGDFATETTLLGRVHITARRQGAVREIVLNPRTGEILRDTWTDQSGNTAPKTIIADVDEDGDDDSGNGGSDDGGSDDDDDSGGSGSGGSGNSGSGGGDDRDDDKDDDRDDDTDDDKDDDSGKGKDD